MKLVGRESLREKLVTFINGDNINRTFLFFGSKDSGKTFIGKYFASLILDDRVFRGTHPDFLYFKGKQGKYAELLEEFLTACHKKPFESNHLVVFFDDIDLLPLVSLNVLLKTLEEPPVKTTIILSAKSKDSLLDTINSRSFKFHLENRTREEKLEILHTIGISDAEARLAISDDIKTCLSKDFDSLKKRVLDNFDVFDKLSSSKIEEIPALVTSFLEKEDLVFFFNSIRNKSTSLDFQLAVNKALNDCYAYCNKFLILFNFAMFLRDGR